MTWHGDLSVAWPWMRDFVVGPCSTGLTQLPPPDSRSALRQLWQTGWGRVMSATSDPVLTEVVRRLVEAYSPERIYLFGSIARGEAGPDSDYDIMVIVPDDAPPERLRSRLAYRALRGTGTAADVVVWPRSSFERRARVAASLPATVSREGMLLYGV